MKITFEKCLYWQKKMRDKTNDIYGDGEMYGYDGNPGSWKLHAAKCTGPFDILSVASQTWKDLKPEETEDLFDLMIITDDGLPVTCFNGMKIDPHMGKDEV